MVPGRNETGGTDIPWWDVTRRAGRLSCCFHRAFVLSPTAGQQEQDGSHRRRRRWTTGRDAQGNGAGHGARRVASPPEKKNVDEWPGTPAGQRRVMEPDGREPPSRICAVRDGTAPCGIHRARPAPGGLVVGWRRPFLGRRGRGLPRDLFMMGRGQLRGPFSGAERLLPSGLTDSSTWAPSLCRLPRGLQLKKPYRWAAPWWCCTGTARGAARPRLLCLLSWVSSGPRP